MRSTVVDIAPPRLAAHLRVSMVHSPLFGDFAASATAIHLMNDQGLEPITDAPMLLSDVIGRCSVVRISGHKLCALRPHHAHYVLARDVQSRVEIRQGRP